MYMVLLKLLISRLRRTCMVPIIDRKYVSPQLIIACLIVIIITLPVQIIGCKNGSPPKDTNTAATALEPQEPDQMSNIETNWAFYGALRKKYQIKDKLISALISSPPRSSWIESEKAFYQGVLKPKNYDVLVVPFQTQSYGLDHIARILMSYKLAISIEKNTDFKIAPLPIVYPALGSLQRYYNEDEVRTYAKELGVSRIIWGFAGTENDSGDANIKLSFSIIDERLPLSGAGSKTRCKKWNDIPLQPSRLPYQEFSANLEAVMKFLNLPYGTSASKVNSDQSKDFQVPASPGELLAAKADEILLRSDYLQFLAMLAPTDYHKTYLYTLSISNLFQLETSSPDRKLIEARAYLHLYRRPAALKALEGMNSPEAEALREFANANLTELRDKVDSLKPSLKRVLSELELFYLKDKYKEKMTNAQVSDYVAKYPGWSSFLKKRLAHYDPWELSSNVELVQLLAKYLPIAGFSPDLLQSNRIFSAGNLADLRPDLAFQGYIHNAISERREILSNDTNLSGNTLALGFLTMAESFGQHNLMKLITIPGYSQYLPDKGLQICDEILKFYKDHPYFTSDKFSLLYNLIEGSPADAQKNIKQEVCDMAINTMWWNGRQNWVNTTARSFLSYLTKPGENDIQPLNPFISKKDLIETIGMDYPFRVNNVQSGNFRPVDSLLPWVHTEIDFLINLYRQYSLPKYVMISTGKDSKKASNILSEMQSRFNGHPDKTKFNIDQKAMENKTIDKKKLLLAEIEKGSRDWKTYKELANLYITDSSYEEAKSIILKYPGLKPPFEADIIGASNIAAAAGNLFFERGAIDQAKYFYQISADLDTGSARCLEGQERLSLLKRKFPAAAEYSLRRAQRYNDPTAYANYMTYLHLQGKHKLAWSMFQNLITLYTGSPELWDSAFIGHRIEGRSDDEIISWLRTLSQSVKTDQQKSYLARFGALCLIDREPNEDMVATIEKYDVNTLLEFYRVKVLSSKNAPLVYSSFAQSYEYLQKKEYKEAYRLLSRNSIFRPQGYYAFAGIKSGDFDKLRKYYFPVAWSPKTNSYYYFEKIVAHAVVECYSGNHEKALSFLKKAFSVRPPTVAEPYFTEQYLLQIAEWLYQDSKDERYAALLLNWSRIFQLITPMYAWPYAIEANYTDNPKEKLKALAYAQFLDPQSTRIEHFSKELRRKGNSWFKSNNPFSANNRDNGNI